MQNCKQYNLICFPHAGAGASMFNEWKELSNEINIIAVQLPGREKKFIEPLYKDVNEAIDGLLTEITSEIDYSIPVVIFGHCLGSLLSFELAHRLVLENTLKIKHLFISGCSGPYNRDKVDKNTLSDNEFINNIESITGYKHPALENPAMRDLVLPILKADVEMNDKYTPSQNSPLEIPITTIRGKDDQLVSPDQIKLWENASSSNVSHYELSGNHMYIMDSAQDLINIINKTLNTGE